MRKIKLLKVSIVAIDESQTSNAVFLEKIKICKKLPHKDTKGERVTVGSGNTTRFWCLIMIE
jgi:hypothetical protein